MTRETWIQSTFHHYCDPREIDQEVAQSPSFPKCLRIAPERTGVFVQEGWTNVVQNLAGLPIAHQRVVSMIFACLLLYSFILISNRHLERYIICIMLDLPQGVGGDFPFQESCGFCHIVG